MYLDYAFRLSNLRNYLVMARNKGYLIISSENVKSLSEGE